MSLRWLCVVSLSWLMIAAAYGEVGCEGLSGIAQEAEKLRGLNFKRHPSCKKLSQTEFQKLSSEIIRAEISLPALEYEEGGLKDLGVVSEEFRYQECLVDLLTSNSAGFYSTRIAGFVVPEWFEVPSFIMIHEAVHALQDQHFDLKRISPYKFIFSDKSLAVGALMEGDAMRIEGEFWEKHPEAQKEELDPQNRVPQRTAACKVPEELQALLDAPYDYGRVFVEQLIRAGGGNRAVDGAFRRPPRSTEQVLHIEKYLNDEGPAPSSIELPMAIVIEGRGLKLKFRDSVGELGIRLMLKRFLSRSSSVLGAKDWGNDRFGVYGGKAGERCTRWRTVWDTVEAARRFKGAVLLMWSKRFGLELDRSVARVAFESGAGMFGSLESGRGNEVGLTICHVPKGSPP